MGVTIHYRGKLDDPAKVDDLRRELTDIGESIGWKWQTLDDDWSLPPNATLVPTAKGATIEGHLGLKGIALIPPGRSEPVSFLFDSKGRLRSIMNVILLGEGRIKPEDAWISVKTQFLSPDAHIWIIGLLKHIQRRHIVNLEVSDEGGYWETGDRAALVAKMQLLNEKIAWLAGELSSERFAGLAGSSAEEIADRIEAFLREKR